MGYLQAGETPEKFLNLLRLKGLSLAPINKADHSFQERSRARLEAVFALSLAALERTAHGQGYPPETWRDAFAALGYGPAAGFGESLGAAIAGFDSDTFADLARAACALSLLDRVPRPDGTAFRLHPLLAELGRKGTDGAAVLARITEWFCERLPMRPTEATNRWNEVHAETAALLDWLQQVPPSDRQTVERAGSRFAINTGPFHAWRLFCETALSSDPDDAGRSNVLWTLGNVALRGGDLDAALRFAREKRDLDSRRGEEREAALASGLIADILGARGELDEALRIHQEEQLPVYERLGDVRSRAVTMGKIADILSARGELEEALRIRREEEMPVYERLGDVRSRAVTMGQIATMLCDKGDFDEAIRLRQDEVLPLLVRLGDAAEVVNSRAWLASYLLRRDDTGDREEAHRLLCLALTDAGRMGLSVAGNIENFMRTQGLSCE